MNTIEIKTDLSGEELQVLIWDLEAFCDMKGLPKPVLKQCSVSGSLPLSGGEIITKAIDRSKDLNRSKYCGTSYRFGYMAGFEAAQSIAVGGNDR